MTTTPTPTSGAADRAIEGCPELNMGNYDEVDVERLNDWAIRANDEIDRRHTLAAGQATAAPENIRGILARCRDFIDTTKAPAYPAGADLADEIDVLLAAQPAPQPSHVAQAVVPSGWNIVPTEPTQAMLDAVVTSMDDFLLGKEAEKQYREDWAAMLAAAPAQPAAQQGVAYAALPEYGINTASHAHFRVLGFTADQMRAFADATHAIRASHGQAPAQTADSQLLQFYGVTTDAELITAQAAHIEKLQAKLTKTPSFAPQRSNACKWCHLCANQLRPRARVSARAATSWMAGHFGQFCELCGTNALGLMKMPITMAFV